MFVVWRKRPIKRPGGAPFLMMERQEIRAWPDQRCNHDGPGRVVWSAMVVKSLRDGDGKPKQQLVLKFPSIRSCCIADDRTRAAWWYVVEEKMRTWKDWNDDLGNLRHREKALMVKKLREVVPKPIFWATSEFDNYVQNAEAVANARREEEFRRRQEESRRFEEEHKQRQERERREREDKEQQKRARQRQAYEDLFAAFGDDDLADAYAVFGFSVGANFDEVKAAYRKLAKQHHPDMNGGDDAKFRHVQEAWEKIEKHHQKRAAS